MSSLALPAVSTLRRPWVTIAAAVGLAVGAAALVAQVGGDRGIIPVASSEDIEVRGIEVDVSGKTAEEARLNGWREAQKLAWEKLGGPAIPDSQLQGLVAAIVVEQERLGPRRYIATLGVVFDRARAGGLLGRDGQRARSAPMLTLPVLISGGTQTMFEVRNPWQRAW
ncbi:MAG TPA: heavy-metal-associated domain-containing protein, partial [Croceibacterium sp.]|nr:heavy-metal-associated domain-containing protein [Croceibacterium sp.]